MEHISIEHGKNFSVLSVIDNNDKVIMTATRSTKRAVEKTIDMMLDIFDINADIVYLESE